MRNLELTGVLIAACAVVATAQEQLPNLTNENPSARFTVTDRVWAANPGDASISLWGDDKLAAMSFTIDDNCYGNVDWWMQTAAQYGFKVTWFLITDRITTGENAGFNGTWTQWQAVAAAGHDIESHTAWHLHTELPEWTGIDDEYRISQEQIETNIPGYKCDFLAYPGGGNSYLNNRTNAATYYAAARGGIGSGFNKPNTIDYMAVKNMGWPTGDFTTNAPSANPNSLFNSGDLRYYRAWAIYLNHLVNDYSTMTPFLNYIDANRSNLWFCTFSEGARYGQERDTATLTTNQISGSRLAYSLSDRMLDSRFNFPLTLKVRLPADWPNVQATQNGLPVESSVVEYNSASYALVKAVPDRGEIVLLPAGASTGFTASPTSGWTPLPVNFTDTSTGTITNRFWNFGDGFTTNTPAVSVSHTYTTGGAYTVTLIVSGPEGESTNTQVSCIVATQPVAPSAAFSAVPTSGAAPLPVNFTDTSTGTITNRFWNFGDGFTTNTAATTVAHTYTSAGTSTVQLIVSGPAGISTNTATVTVTLPVAPVAAFSASPVSGTAPLAVTFTDTSTGSITNRLWNFGDGITTNTAAAGVAHTYTAAGTYTVQLAVSGPSGSDTDVQTGLISVTAPVSTGSLTHLDISSAFDYDAFVTDEEIAYATGQGKLVPVAIGDHADDYVSVRPGNGYSHAVTPNHATYQGIPADGIVDSGGFELAKGLTTKWGVAAGNAKVANSAARFYDGTALVKTVTITLTAGDQKKYANLNVLVNGSRYTTTAGPFSAALSVKYTGDANWYTVWTETAQIGEPGGVFGGEYSGGSGAGNSYQSSAWTPVTVSDGEGVTKVVGGLTVVGVGSSYMYKLTTPAVLDSSRVLEAIKLEATTANKSRVNEFQLFAASAVEAAAEPEPAAADADADGLPDEWEIRHFGGSAHADPDAHAANGVNTIREAYIAGLNPTNPASNFAVSKDRNILGWNATSGRVYSVYWTTNLLSGFQPLETNLVWPQNSWTDTVHGAEAGVFYRIKVRMEQ